MFDPSLSVLSRSNDLASGNSFPGTSAPPANSADLRDLGSFAVQKGAALSLNQTLDFSVEESSNAIQDHAQDLTQAWSAFPQLSTSVASLYSSAHQSGDSTTGTATSQAMVGIFGQDDLTQNSGASLLDWYAQNLTDVELIGVARSLAADGELSRLDMIGIFRSAEDNFEIDAAEVIDLRTIVAETNQFTRTS